MEQGNEEAGYDALMTRLRQAKQTCDDVKNMFNERNTNWERRNWVLH